MTKADLIVERGASFLEELARKAASEGGFAAKLAEPLAEDAVFLRKLKPTLVMARLRGEAPSDGHMRAAPSTMEAAPALVEPAPAPKEKPKVKKEKKSGGGPNAIVVAAAAFAVGVLAAKFVDWRGHAHPRF
jgi:hypothetical protein